METDLSQFVPDVHFEQIPIKNLVSNQDYQRRLSLRHVEKAATHFDPYQINPVKVSRRDGINYVFNGQHTIEIIALVSGSRETPVWCMVYDGLEYEHEADIFANQMKYVKPLLPYETFIANIEAGSDKHILINSLVESFGIEISSSQSSGGICAVSTLEYIYDTYGYDNLNRTLTLCIGTWEGAPHSLSGNMLRAVARLAFTYGDSLKDDIFKDKLGCISIREIIRSARERREGHMGYAEALLSYYNKKMRFPLRQEYLYSRKPVKRRQMPVEIAEPPVPQMEPNWEEEENPG